MDNFIINNNTIALLKNNNTTIIYDVDNMRVINKNIKKILNMNCNMYGSSYEGRREYSKIILNKCYKLPIILNKTQILLQLSSIRKEECLFLILDKILNYKFKDNYLYINCVNNNVFKVKISEKSFEKILVNSIKLNNLLINQKYTNIV